MTREQLDSLAAEFRYVVTACHLPGRFGTHRGGWAGGIVVLVLSPHEGRSCESRMAGPRPAGALQGPCRPGALHGPGGQGFFPMAWLTTMNNGGRLPSHMRPNRTPGVDMTTGSLGRGSRPRAAWRWPRGSTARTPRLLHHRRRGVQRGPDLGGGDVRRALQARNLIVITDCNGMQIDGRTDEIMKLEPLAEKWAAFGWDVIEIDGHDGTTSSTRSGRAAPSRASRRESPTPSRARATARPRAWWTATTSRSRMKPPTSASCAAWIARYDLP